MESLRLGPETVDAEAKQVMAEKAIDFMSRANRKIAEDLDSVFLGVTSQDLNIKSAGWQLPVWPLRDNLDGENVKDGYV